MRVSLVRVFTRVRDVSEEWLVECKVSVGTDAAEKQVYSAETFDGCLVGCALCFEVGSVAVENVDVGGRYVDVVKQVAVHEG